MADHGGPWRTIHSAHHHCGWDNAIELVARIAPGETITLECLDAAGGHYTRKSTSADIATMDPDAVNPVTGPLHVDGAEPGDALKVTIVDLAPSGFGWSALIPGFGLLADQFPDPYLQLWDYDRAAREPALFGTHARVPLKPFVGTIGLAPAAPGRHAIIPPRRVGGNMDVRDLAAGTELILPVEVEGALFSAGDTHAAQGDGEVCGTAIESAMDLTVRVDLIKDAAPRFPRFSTPGPVTRHLDGAGYEVTTGIGPDLMAAARDAVSGMIDHLGAWRQMPPEDAYVLCSVCGDLRISEIVDAPNWVVSFYLPRIVFA
ncbi:MAG: acetamidase/formamidase family protein [Roseitalea porphyridii]|jgi:acetamidase/formamidase|uniref:acetamidase/formamidase family protein n=1 Tax=Roseitalea porphyridii TaxID=1852022 RepID=UPI0032EF3721